MLEIIVETVADALAAEAGGATQLDLKSAAELDGLTPTLGMIEQICSRVQIDVMVMVRPHKKKFCTFSGRHCGYVQRYQPGQAVQCGGGVFAWCTNATGRN